MELVWVAPEVVELFFATVVRYVLAIAGTYSAKGRRIKAAAFQEDGGSPRRSTISFQDPAQRTAIDIIWLTYARKIH